MVSTVSTILSRQCVFLSIFSIVFILSSFGSSDPTKAEEQDLLVKVTRESHHITGKDFVDDDRRELEVGWDNIALPYGAEMDDAMGRNAKKGGDDDDGGGKKGGDDDDSGKKGGGGDDDDDDDDDETPPGIGSVCIPNYDVGDNPCLVGCGHSPVPNPYNRDPVQAERVQYPSPCLDYECICADSGCLKSWDEGCIKWYIQCQTETQVCGSLSDAPTAVQEVRIEGSCAIAPASVNTPFCFPQPLAPVGPSGPSAPVGPSGPSAPVGPSDDDDDDSGKKGGDDDDSGKKGGDDDDSGKKTGDDDDSGKKGDDDDDGKKGGDAKSRVASIAYDLP